MLGKVICISCKLLCRQARKFLLQRVGDMFTYRLYIAPEQLRHLVAIQPHCLIFEADIQPDGFVRLVDDDLVPRRGGETIRLRRHSTFHCTFLHDLYPLPAGFLPAGKRISASRRRIVSKLSQKCLKNVSRLAGHFRSSKPRTATPADFAAERIFSRSSSVMLWLSCFAPGASML